MLLQVLLETFLTDFIIYFIVKKRISSFYQEGQINIFHKGSGRYDCRQNLNGRKLVTVTSNLQYVNKCQTQRPQTTDSVGGHVLFTVHESLACSPLIFVFLSFIHAPRESINAQFSSPLNILDTFPHLCCSYLVQGKSFLHYCILNSFSPAGVLAFNSLTSPNQYVISH